MFGAATGGKASALLQQEGKLTITADLKLLKQEVGEFGSSVGRGARNFGEGFIGYKPQSGILRSSTPEGLIAEELVGRTTAGVRNIRQQGTIASEEGLNLRVQFEEGMNLRDFNRKVNRLENQIQRGNAETNIPHGVSDSSRRSLTRSYRRNVSDRIESLYKNHPQMRENALRKLRESDIDHILDLQLGGMNTRNNLKTLHSRTNQRLGSQISTQIPRNQTRPITGLEVNY